MRSSPSQLLSAAAALLTGAVLAAAGEPEPKPEPWSSSQRGLAVLIKAVNPEVTEVTGGPTDPAGRIEFQLLVKNVSGAPLTLKVEALDEAAMGWSIAGADGSRWAPMFAQAKPGGAAASRKLEPNEVLAYATVRGMILFARAGESGPAARAMLPAGTYTAAAQSLRLPGTDGSVSSNPVTVKVLRADGPVNGLKLSLSAEKTETTLAAGGKQTVPIKLKLTFTNVGDRALKLNLHDLAWASLVPDVELSANVPARLEVAKLPARPTPPPAPKAEDYPVLEPGKSWVFEDLAFPGDCGRRHYAHSGPAGAYVYRVRMNYKPANPAPGNALAKDCWTGNVRSNEIAFTIK